MVKHRWWMALAWLPLGFWAHANEAARPVVKVGDVATYVVNMRGDKRTVEEVVTVLEVTGAQIRSQFARPDRTAEGLTTREWGLVVSAASNTRFDPPIQSLKFPLTVGEAWTSKYVGTGTNQSQARGDLEFKVAATEKVQTPAGEFDTFRIESKGWVTGITWQGVVQVRQTFWYAPSISRYVKTEFQDWRNGRLWTDNLTELKSFKPAP
ncbi:hypothetical protein [Hydrogenophaga sp. BPS33]|uniref:hypothetical protein n=1 Tax=Hydrogenophaga sp. BPS33 TaxID=2651974 RepID=UPI00131F66E7|nr:hypothetical protein [Hydrogenophaga sp. BPS33]QHE88021.1 hypothetical protein F9K07_25560 [Hydrogenophaga sp. BPS33]